VNGYAHGIHTDVTQVSAERAYFGALRKLSHEWPGDANLNRSRSGRFVFLNAWRNIADVPNQNHHLACCDVTSLTPNDYILSERTSAAEQHNGHTYYALNAANHSRHRWYYSPHMVKSEILVFQQWDSVATVQFGRSCFHTAIKDPSAPRGIPARESVEVRAIAFSPHHQPNTRPNLLRSIVVMEPWAAAPTATVMVASRILYALEHMERWPWPAQMWVRRAAKPRGVSEQVLGYLLQDR